ncbi:MAG: hypothetical protein RR324_01120 [Cellulosilyticaceae bacterium]
MPYWNKVCIRLDKDNGEKVNLKFIIKDSIKVGDKVWCHTRKGVCHGSVLSIVDTRVNHLDTHCKVEPANETTNKKYDKAEVIKMFNELFAVAVVENRSGYNNLCKLIAPVSTGTEVVYEGNDGNKHVGVVKRIFAQGKPIEGAKRYQLGGFVVAVLDDYMINQAKEREVQYKAAQEELRLRKERFEQRSIYEMLAERDPEAKKLLDYMDSLTSPNNSGIQMFATGGIIPTDSVSIADDKSFK